MPLRASQYALARIARWSWGRTRSNCPTAFPRQRAHRYFLLAPLASISIVLFLFLAFLHKPGWYRPARIDAKDANTLQAIRKEATNRFDDFGRKLVDAKPFDVTVSDAALNNLLGILPEFWPDAAERIPPEMIDPAVAFENGAVRIGVVLDSSSLRFVAGARCSIAIAPDASTLRLTLDGISAGSLPIPRSIIAPALQRVEARAAKNDVGRGSPAATISHSPSRLFDGVSIRNEFTWPNGKRRFRIRTVSITEGQIRLGIEPL